MKRAIIALLIIFLSVFSIYSAPPESAYSYDDLSFSALYSPSYSGRYLDSLINPSSLSLRESDNVFYFTFLLSEAWDTDLFRANERLYGIQHLSSELRVSFVGDSLSLTAYSTNYFADRQLTESGLSFDIYNRIGLDITYSFSYEFFSFGIKMEGGGEMRRRDRTVSGLFNAFENAYFGAFDNIDGSEFFDVGASLALNFEIFSLSYYVENLISYRGNDLYFGLSNIVDSGTISFMIRYPEFTSRGDLNIFRPRLAYSIRGNLLEETRVTISTDLEMQLLPTLSLHLAIAYREYDHYFFNFNRNNGIMMFAFSVEGEAYSVALMCNVDTLDFSHVYPSIAVSFSR